MVSIPAQVHAPAAQAARITDLVTLAGLRPTPRAELALLVTHRDDPGVADQWLVDSLPHLVVRLSPHEIRLGPFVQPGVTACLRCVQSSMEEAAPAGAADGDVDPALLMAALGMAVRDLATWLSGDLPVTWSSSLTLSAGLTSEVTRWLRHPHCGCSWGPIDHLSAPWTSPAVVRRAG